MSYWGWPCGCPQCTEDNEEEYDPFEEWALEEVERQLEAATDYDFEKGQADWEMLYALR